MRLFFRYGIVIVIVICVIVVCATKFFSNFGKKIKGDSNFENFSMAKNVSFPSTFKFVCENRSGKSFQISKYEKIVNFLRLNPNENWPLVDDRPLNDRPLDDRPTAETPIVFLTAASWGHFHDLKTLIPSFFFHFPNETLHIYDLGLRV